MPTSGNLSRQDPLSVPHPSPSCRRDHFLSYRLLFFKSACKVWDCSATYFRPITYFGNFLFLFWSFPSAFNNLARYGIAPQPFSPSIYLEITRRLFVWIPLQEQINQFAYYFPLKYTSKRCHYSHIVTAIRFSFIHSIKFLIQFI